MKNIENILVLDFGGKYKQLIARTVRNNQVYSEVYNDDLSIEEIKKINPSGIILTGGSYYAGNDIPINEEIFELNVPILGIEFEGKIVENKEFSEENIKTFLFEICKLTPNWNMESFARYQINHIKETLKDQKVLLALSGGVDSSVVAAILSKAIGKNLTCIFVNHGLLRKYEVEQVTDVFTNQFDLNFIKIEAAQRYYNKLRGVIDPEQKRKIIGEEFIRIFEEESQKLGNIDYLAQGTIYPDIIESGAKNQDVIKSHHNVGGLPETIDFKGLVEPLRDLFKDEVRELGKILGLPDYIVNRQPFPGPGLGVRIVGEVNADKVKIVQDADYIFREEIEKAGLNKEIAQYFAALTNLRSVGIKNGQRTYDYAVSLRAVITKDFMTAKAAELPYSLLRKVTDRIVTEVEHVNRVFYDLTNKPSGTSELE